MAAFMTRSLTPVHEDATMSLFSAEELAFIVWRDAPTGDQVRRWHRFALEHARGPYAPGACVDIIVRGTPRFSDEVRREAQRLASDPKVFPRGIAHVILLGGLPGSAVRAFIQTVLLVTKQIAPAKVFGDFGAAASWTEKLLDAGPAAASARWTAADIRSLSSQAANRPPPV